MSMKQLLINLFFSGIFISAMAQPSSAPLVHLTYEYKNMGLGQKRTVTVSYRNHESISIMSPEDSIGNGQPPADFNLNGEDDMGRQVYKNTVTGEVTFRDFTTHKGSFEPCIVRDPMAPMRWTFSNERKTIGKFSCARASTTFRGRNYLAWYTDDLPVPHGPWKFNGLPGAIVALQSDDMIIQFTLTRVETRSAMTIQRPVGGEVLTMEEYLDRKDAALDDFVSRLAATLPRGAQISVSTSDDYNLETAFPDIKRN